METKKKAAKNWHTLAVSGEQCLRLARAFAPEEAKSLQALNKGQVITHCRQIPAAASSRDHDA